jgi:hypothetical protein
VVADHLAEHHEEQKNIAELGQRRANTMAHVRHAQTNTASVVRK